MDQRRLETDRQPGQRQHRLRGHRLEPQTTYYLDVAAYNAVGPTWANSQSAIDFPLVFHGHGGFSDTDQPVVAGRGRRDQLPGR